MRFMSLAVLAHLTLGTIAFAQAEEPSESVIALGVGQKRALALPGITRIAIGDTEVADAKLLGDTLELTGQGPGKTTLMLWQGTRRTAYLLHVKGEKRAEGEAALKSAALEPANETLALERGESRTLAFKNLKRLAVGHPDIVEVRATKEGNVEVRALNAGDTNVIIWREGEPRYTVRIEVR